MNIYDDKLEEFGVRFCERLKLARKARGLSMRQLADVSGVSYATVVLYERKERISPTLFTVAKISLALNVSIDWLSGLTSLFDVDTQISQELERFVCKALAKEKATSNGPGC